MRTHLFTDVALSCIECGDDFVFTAGEQEMQALRGRAETPPHHCSRCRRARLGAAPRPETVATDRRGAST
jgi:hypothetical protein